MQREIVFTAIPSYHSVTLNGAELQVIFDGWARVGGRRAIIFVMVIYWNRLKYPLKYVVFLKVEFVAFGIRM